MLVLGFFSKAICSSKNYLSLTEALALSFSSSGCNYFTALESGEIKLLFR
jgi:TfoX/Sxy family transcriptional regulator of competence genes